MRQEWVLMLLQGQVVIVKVVKKVYRHHLRAAVKNPHHYITAVLLTVMGIAIGHTTETIFAWFYAISETIVEGEEK